MTDLEQATRSLAEKDHQRAFELFLKHAASCPAEAAQAYAGAADCCLRCDEIKARIPRAPGITLVSPREHRRAEYYFKLALQADPNNAKALWGLSQVLPEASQERREMLERSVAVEPNAFNLVELANYYRNRLNDPEGAYALYKRAHDLFPQDETMSWRLHDFCRRTGRVEEAEDWYERWLVITEEQWLASHDLRHMIFHRLLPASELRLFAVACCRRLTHLLHDQRSLAVLDAVEAYAHANCTKDELRAAERRAADAVEEIKERSGLNSPTGLQRTPELSAAEIARDTAEGDPFEAAELACYGVAFVMAGAVEEEAPGVKKELEIMRDLLRKIVTRFPHSRRES